MKSKNIHPALLCGLTLSLFGASRTASAQEPSSPSAGPAPGAEVRGPASGPVDAAPSAEGAAPEEPGPNETTPGESADLSATSPAGAPAPAAPEISAQPVDAAPLVAEPGAPRVLPADPYGAQAAEPPAEPLPDPNTLPFTYHQIHFDLQLSFGPAFLTDAATDPFSSTKTFALLGARLGVAPLRAGRFAFAALLEGRYGSAGGDARGTRTSLELGVLGVGLEARYHFHHQFYGYARLSPGAAFMQRSLHDPVLPLHGGEWGFALGGHAGLAARIAGSADGRDREARVWLFVEAGYLFTETRASTLRPAAGSTALVEFEAPGLSLSGPDLALGIALTY